MVAPCSRSSHSLGVRLSIDVDHGDAFRRYLANGALSFTDAIVATFRWSADKQDAITFDKAIVKAAHAKRA